MYLRFGTGTGYKIPGKYTKGTQVIAVDKTTSGWYKVSCPDGKHGYKSASYLQYVKAASTPQEAKHEVMEARQLRDQPFRICRVLPELDNVTVYTYHIFYDLIENMICSYKPSSSAAGAAFVYMGASRLGAPKGSCRSPLGVSFSNLRKTMDITIGEMGCGYLGSSGRVDVCFNEPLDFIWENTW